MGKYFGTDGVRGIANKELTPELAFKLGRYGGYVLSQQENLVFSWAAIHVFQVRCWNKH